jgi:glycosyltransferase involved in cell wall biosynthesis
MTEHPIILFVTEKFPWPLDDGGQIRTYQVLRSLSASFSVILVSLSPSFPEDEQPVRDLGVEVITFPGHHPSWGILWYVTQTLFTKRPYPLPKNFSSEILDEIRRRMNTGRVQALHLNHLDAAQYVDWLDGIRPKVRIVFDTHNLLTSLYARLVKSEENLLRKTYSWIQWRKMCVYEQATMHKADCVVVCSELEQQILQEWRVKNCLVVPNGVDTQFFTPRPMLPKAEGRLVHLVFTGAMDYLPNADGVRWFLRAVLPELDQRLSRYKLTIVGKNPPADLRNWERPGRIEFTGRVEDVRLYTCLADVFVVPLQIGGGTRLKILEALAMQVPVVSTRVGAEGLELCDRVHLRLADDAPAMARTISELCARPDHAQEIARRGREYVLKRYDWSAVTFPLCRYYEKALCKD